MPVRSLARPLAGVAVPAAVLAAVIAATRAAELTAPRPRTPLTTSRVVGTPEPPKPYKLPVAFPHLRFERPIHLTHAPGTDRLVVCEQGGRIVTFPNRPDVKAADVLLDVPKDLPGLKAVPGAKGFDTLFAVAFHPKFPAVRDCFVAYTLSPKKGPNLPDGSRVSRFAVTADHPPRIDPASERVVLTFTQGGHNGCDLQFGPDGMLYISTGDHADPNPPDKFRTGQDVTDLGSSVLRIDVDRADPGRPYAVPADNPFVGATQNGKPARPEVWAFGLRNPFRMGFDRATGDLWVGDVGWEQWELVHKVERGGNYGWSLTEGRQAVYPNDPPGPGPVRPPVIELSHAVAGSVTGGFVYRGKKHPDLAGRYVFGDWMTRRMWAAKVDGAKLVSLDEVTDPAVRVVGFGEDRDGELYALDYDTGTVHTFEKNPAVGTPADFPRTLSATGLFASTKDGGVAPGVERFEPAARQWQDHALSEHFVALPGTSAVQDLANWKAYPGHLNWFYYRFMFPPNAVLMKTFSLDMVAGDPASRRRVETQLLHWDGGDWRAYTYAWRDDQSDADLVPADGADKVLTVKDPRHVGGVRRQTWPFHSRTQCFTCHNPWARYTLAFQPEQLNRAVDTPAGPRNQFVHLTETGVLQRFGKQDEPLPPYTEAEARKQPKLADPFGDGPVANRARAYLHANCAHCHRFGGGGSVDLELVADKGVKDLKVVDVPPKQGGFELPDPKVVAAGRPEGSSLLYRMAKFGRGRMPHMGSELPDDRGVALVRDWVKSLGKARPADLPPPATESDVAARLGAVGSALELTCAMGRPGFPPAVRAQVLAAAEKLPPGPARELFDGYFPSTGEAKLGPNPKPAAILALTGDPARGGELVRGQRMQCLNCHKLDGAGVEVGPDLSAVGKQRTRDELLESLVEPSKKVDPAYQSYLVLTVDGRSLGGLLVRRDDTEVVLKDAQGKPVAIPAADVESLRPAAESLMPAGLLADLTPQQAADVVAFLASRTGGR